MIDFIYESKTGMIPVKYVTTCSHKYIFIKWFVKTKQALG